MSGGERESSAVVTGAGSGIGQAIAVGLASVGFTPILADIDRDAAEATAELIDGRATVVVCDVSDPAAVRSLFDALRGQPPLRVLVNAAGVAGRGPIDEVDEALWDRVIAVNLTAVYRTCRAALPFLRSSGGGTIVNIASVAGLREQATSPIYSASKGGVVMFSRSLAAALVGEGIRVAALCPPPVDTPMLAEIFAGDDDPAASRRAYGRAQPGGHLATPAEMADIIVRLVQSDTLPYSTEPLLV